MPPMNSHPQRIALHNEIHARPPESLSAPLAITHMVMVCDAAGRERSRAHVSELLRNHHLALPDPQSTHLRVDMGPFRLRWELHTEFVTYTFMRPLQAGADYAPHSVAEPPRAMAIVPQDWLAGVPGENLVNLHLWVLSADEVDGTALVKKMLREDSLVAAKVAATQAQVHTDFAIHADGASRMLLLVNPDGGHAAGSADAADAGDAAHTSDALLSPRRLGRLVQQLLEIETYRMCALLGLPAARGASGDLTHAERELAQLAEAIRSANRNEEPQLLDRLTRLAGQVESQYAATHSRFSASAAYFELVDQRIADIEESRLDGMQTIGEFMERRLTPARNTCEWADRRQNALSQRVSRVSSLLRTRVEIEQQQTSQTLLGDLSHRQGLQLKLQSTVEGLSVAAITYYIVGLVSYVAKAAQPLGWPISPEGSAALAIPLVAGLVWWSLRRLHNKLMGAKRDGNQVA